MKKINNLKRTLSNQSGVTLIELISVLSISGLLILISAVGLSVFFSKYRELNTWVELQADALNCINTIKTGIPVGTNQDVQFYGVVNAKKIELMGAIAGSTSGNGILCIPPILNSSHSIDKAQYYYDGRAVRVNYVYKGVQASAPMYLFPKQEKLDQIEITKFRIYKENAGPELYVVRVELSARTKIAKGKYKSVNFKTQLARNI